jgi:hypothetical protein
VGLVRFTIDIHKQTYKTPHNPNSKNHPGL